MMCSGVDAASQGRRTRDFLMRGGAAYGTGRGGLTQDWPCGGRLLALRWIALALAILVAVSPDPGSGCARAAEPAGTVVRPEDTGAVGDGLVDDAPAMQSAIDKASGGVLELREGATYLLGGGLAFDSPITVRGKAVLLTNPGIEKVVGVKGGDSVIRIRSGAQGSLFSDFTVDLGGAGRNAIDVGTSDVEIRSVTVRNYRKSVKSDRRRHGVTESGLRIRESSVRVIGFRCEDMYTRVHDSVPRCINVQGGASAVSLRQITGERINGGITIASSSGVTVEGYEFNELTDNGLYLLPGSVDVIALNGVMRDTTEPVVFKGTNAKISGLRIHNQGYPFGIENASGVVLEDVWVTHDPGFDRRPAFLRTRPKNKLTTDVVVRRVDVEMPFGDSVFSLGHGELRRFKLLDSSLRLSVEQRGVTKPFLLRVGAGEDIEIRNSTFTFKGVGADRLQKVRIRIPEEESRGVTDPALGNRILKGQVSLPIEIVH